MLCASDEFNARLAVAERHLENLMEEIDGLEIHKPEPAFEAVA